MSIINDITLNMVQLFAATDCRNHALPSEFDSGNDVQ